MRRQATVDKSGPSLPQPWVHSSATCLAWGLAMVTLQVSQVSSGLNKKNPNVPKEKWKREFCQINTRIRLATQLPHLTQEIQLGRVASDKGEVQVLAFSVMANNSTESNEYKMKFFFKFDFSNQLHLKKPSLGISQRGGSALCADRGLSWELTGEAWGSKLEQSYGCAGRGGDRGDEGLDMKLQSIGARIQAMCKKKKKEKEKEGSPLWTGSRYSDMAESTNVLCLDFNKALDIDSSDNFIIKLKLTLQIIKMSAKLILQS